MGIFALPPTTTEHKPAVLTGSGCRLWLDELPLANVVQSQSLMTRQLSLLNRYTLPAAERLQILEYIRVPLSVIQEGSVPRYAGKPMPLAPAEQASFESTMALWNALLIGYLHCFEATLGDPVSPAIQVALLAQRALASLCETQADTYPGARLPGAEFWQLLHRIYATADERGATQLEVADLLRNGRHPTTLAATYAEALLLHGAGPSEFSGRQYSWIVRWSRRWSEKVAIRKQRPEDLKTAPLCLDIASSLPPLMGSPPPSGGELRWLDVTELRSSLRKRLQKLADGTAPAELGLGSDCVMPGCRDVLEHVYTRWCKGVPTRPLERRPATGICQVISGIDSIHAHFSGRIFQQPGASLTTRQHEEIAVFGQTSMHQVHALGKKPGAVSEDWSLVDQSATGLHITRPLHQTGGRFGTSQLIAVRPENVKQFLLGWLRWIHVDADNTLHAGVHIFPAVPEAMALRNRSSALVAEKFRPGFLLPEIRALGIPARVIVPPGMFRQDIVIEIFREELSRISLTCLLERGVDFECAAYQTST